MVVVDTVAAELERVNNGNRITPDFEFRPNREVADMLRFDPAFLQLSNILSRNETPSFTPQSLSPDTTPLTQTVPPTHLQSTATPFLHLTFSANPRYSTESSGSNESGPEAPSNSFVMAFLEATFLSVKAELDEVKWYNYSGYRIKPQ